MNAKNVVLFPHSLRRAVWRINENCPFKERKATKESIFDEIEKVRDAATRGDYNFRNYSKIEKNVNGKSREIKRFWGWQTENVLSVYLKLVLDSNMSIKYPNRRNVIKSLFNQLYLLKNFRNYTVLRFDFKDFFESLSTEYVFKKFVNNFIKDRNNIKLFLAYCDEIKKCHVGLPLSNAFAEIAGRAFDEAMNESFIHCGLIYYTRYVDDCIIILSKRETKNDCFQKIKTCLEKVFGDKFYLNNTKNEVDVHLSGKKFQYFTDEDLPNLPRFDFLGYEVFFTLKEQKNKLVLSFLYGITKEKRDKYESKVAAMIDQCSDIKCCELLRHRIQAFCRRIVYRKNIKKTLKWNVKGFISDYSELRYHLSAGRLHDDTEKFLRNVISEACIRKFGELPYFLRTEAQHKPHPAYTLYNNMEKNRTLFFDPDFQLGIGRDSLIKKLRQVDKEIIIEEVDTYHSILHKYLGQLWVLAE